MLPAYTFLFYLAISETWKSITGPSDDGTKMVISSEESLQAGEYVIERGIYKFLNPDDSVSDQGK